MWKADKILNVKKIGWNFFIFSWRKFILKCWSWWKSMVLEGLWRGFRLATQQKIWNLKPKLVRKVVQTCPFVLKLCEVVVLISFTTSENFIEKYWFLVKLSTIFDFTLNHDSYFKSLVFQHNLQTKSRDWRWHRKSSITSLKINIFRWNFQKL